MLGRRPFWHPKTHLVSLLLKSDSHLPKNFVFICFNESPLKIMKNAFHSILKALFVFKIIKFLSWLFLSCREIRKLRLVSKYITPQPGKLTITIHILLFISIIIGNRTMKNNRLREYNVGSIFLQKSREAGRLVPDLVISFLQKSFLWVKSKWSAR